MSQLEDDMALTSTSDFAKTAELHQVVERHRVKLEQMEEEWLHASEELEALSHS
jgi:hypothetical protein